MNSTFHQEIDKGRVLDPTDSTVGARYKLNDIFCTAWLSHALTALAKHGVPDAVADTPTPVEQIAEATGLHTPSLYRVLRAAAANGVFTETEEGFFVHNEVSQLLRCDHPFSWKGMACMWNHPSCLNGWIKFSDCLTDGRSGIEHAFGKPLYEHLSSVPGATTAFSDAMISNSAHASTAIARSFPFGQFQSVTDVGGGVGTLLCAILEEHRHLKGVILEIPELKDEAERYLSRRGLSSRAKVVAGNFLEEVSPRTDLYLVKNSLWNWDDDNCSSILKNIRESIGTDRNARFVIIEYIIDEQNAPWTTLYDLQILNMPGGRARTILEYAKLLSKSGFIFERVQQVEDQTLMIAKPF